METTQHSRPEQNHHEERHILDQRKALNNWNDDDKKESRGPPTMIQFETPLSDLNLPAASSFSPVSPQDAQLLEVSQWYLEQAPELPPLLPLEESSVFCKNVSVALVAARISRALRDLSIQARYTDNAAVCMTREGQEFGIYLYHGPRNYNHGIIVEIQRHSTVNFDFRREMRYIFCAAKAKSLNKPLCRVRSSSCDSSDDSSSCSQLNPTSSSLATNKGIRCLKFATKLMGQNEELALRSLLNSTNHLNVGYDQAKATCHDLVCGGHSHLLVDIFHRLSLRPTAWSNGDIRNSCDENNSSSSLISDDESFESSHEDTIHMLALQIIANLEPYMSTALSKLARHMLLAILNQVEDEPQRAYWALMALAPEMQDLPLLQHLVSVGDRKHADLMELAYAKIAQVL